MAAAHPVRRTGARTIRTPSPAGGSGVAVFTLVLWIGCLLVGGLGFTLSYARPAALPAEPEPVQAEFLNVQLTQEELPEIEPAPANSIALPAPAEAIVQPRLPQAIAVAEPSSAIAFALPVAAPARVVPAAEAGYSRASEEASGVVVPTPQTLTFGRGEGRQPAPDYPLVARRQGQEGAVKVRLTVGSDGRVVTAEAVDPSPWQMLNESAVRTVRHRWRFTPGSTRLFEVIIRFQIAR